MTPSFFEAAGRLFHKAIEDRRFPGGQLLVARQGQILWSAAAGAARWEPASVATTLDTAYDLASLTKPLVTATCIALLVADGRLGLDDPLEQHLPTATGRPIGRATIRQLLSHRSGLPAWKPYYESLSKRLPVNGEDFALARATVVANVLKETLLASPGQIETYSDLDFILLGEVIATIHGEPLQNVFRRRIAEPLGLSADFMPLPVKNIDRPYAATEVSVFRKRLLIGEVDDDNAFVMGGVAGHAGLFGTAGDVFRVCQTWLDAFHGHTSFLPQEVVREFWTRASTKADQTWALGWDAPTAGASTAGRYFSPRAVGHLGFTGTSVWIEPEHAIIVCLLTNRVHPSRDNDSLKTFRPEFHDAVMEGLRNVPAH